MITLSNIYSREKTLFYFTMWNDSDRLGYERFLGYKVNNNLFIIPPVGEKGSVWYPSEELVEIDELLNKKFLDPSFESEIVKTLDTEWGKLTPYLKENKSIENAEELLSYYKALIEWWSAMNTVFTVPDKENAPIDFKATILEYRVESEKYTEKMNKVFVNYWMSSHYSELVTVLLPEEAAAIAAGKVSNSLIEEYHSRLEGCFMLNRTIYPLAKLNETLANAGLRLESIGIEKVAEIKGRTAFKGKVIGPVKVIKIMADTTKIKPGDILVTEMTNPDYVPFMKIAGAIVTNEGGATCHAAIASRELKVPCVVGTKIATKVFKDGDMVEVDAERGIVRIVHDEAKK
jgi:phosphohistidine swiveling domain-containing protein